MRVDIACICPPKADGEPRHAADTVTLRETLDFRSAAACRNAISLLYQDDPDASIADVLAVLSETYLLGGVEAWSLIGPDGKPMPVSKPLIRSVLLARTDVAMEVADAAHDIYNEAVLLPLLRKASMSSPPSPTDDSTSPRTGSTDEAPTPSKRSSTTTTPMDDTEPTFASLVGVSSS